MAIQVGQTLGNYKLIRQLGSGAFGEVYLGENIHIGTQVAIKVLQGNFSPQDVQDFEEEARKIAAVVHPHIVRLLDFGKLDLGRGNKIPFMVMGYADNGTLEDRHPQGRQVPLADVVSYVKKIAEALQYAHDNKIIHRDIKPANIFVGRYNEILVGDFGIAVNAHSTLTQKPQGIAGTVAYMAPEQIQKFPRPASDQYSLAIMVYEWLSGTLPFDGTDREIAIKHLTIPPPSLQAKIPTISLTVEQTVLKALAKDPKQRYPRIQDFAQALEQACDPNQTINFAQLPTSYPQPLAPTIPAVSPRVQPVSPPIQQPQPRDLDRLYKEGVMAQSVGDLERAAFLWQQILQHDRNYQNGTLRFLFWELAPQRIKDRMRQARAAKTAGDWQREIDLWNEVTDVLSRQSDPKYREAKQIRAEAAGRIPTARQNLQNKPLYEHAQQLLNNRNRDAAKSTLKTLWRHAPFYGDPSGLAKKAGMYVPLSLDPYTKKRLYSYLAPISLAGMYISLFICLVSFFFSPLFPVSLVTIILFLLLYLFTHVFLHNGRREV